jgi:hypothetical protein
MMQIDNSAAAQALSDRLEATVPFPVRAGKELLNTMRSKGDRANADTVFRVDLVKYAGDMGGITCGLEPLAGQAKPKEKFVVSLTHLKLDPTHPLAAEVEAYQRNRIQRLKLQEQKGFAAELLASQSTVKRKPSKGFGQ